MLQKIYQSIRGYIRIRISGDRTERFLNACSYKKIQIWDISVCGSSYEMNLWVKDFKKLRHLSHKIKVKITIVEKHGFPFYLFHHRKRKLFFAGITFSFLLLVIMSGFVWDIDISGNQTRTGETILDSLKTKHVYPGMRLSDVDCDRIAKDIRREFHDIIWVSASINGTRLEIQLKENEDVTPEETNETLPAQTDETDNKGTDLIADCSGTVIRIITRSGIPKVQEGTQVLQGDILVSGQIPITNDASEVTGYHPCNSDADIYIQTQLPYQNTLSRKYPDKEAVRYPDLYSVYFRLGKYRMAPYLWKPYKQYSICSRESQIKLLDHFYLPVYVGITRQTPCKIVHKNYTSRQLKDKLNRYFLRYCEDLDKKGVEIIQNDVKIDTGSKEGTISGTLTVIQKAGNPRISETPTLPDHKEEQSESLGE